MSVGIDTLTPSEKLHVSGGNILIDRKESINTIRTMTIGGAQTSNLQPFAAVNFQNFDHDSGASDYIAAGLRSYNATSLNSRDLRFYTNLNTSLTERIRILPNGRVGIGTDPLMLCLL